jgi:hypothetical protein
MSRILRISILISLLFFINIPRGGNPDLLIFFAFLEICSGILVDQNTYAKIVAVPVHYLQVFF